MGNGHAAAASVGYRYFRERQFLLNGPLLKPLVFVFSPALRNRAAHYRAAVAIPLGLFAVFELFKARRAVVDTKLPWELMIAAATFGYGHRMIGRCAHP